jgi:hypothetical protein
MSSYSTLRNVRELLGDPRKWTRGAIARTADDSETHPRSPNAASWCLIGAAEACAPDRLSYWAARSALVAEISRRVPGTGIPRFNDTATHEELLAIIEGALRRAAISDR